MTAQRGLLTLCCIGLVGTTAIVGGVSLRARAKAGGFAGVTKALEVQYGGTPIRIPFLGLADLVLKIVRPAGIKGCKIAIFEDLNFPRGEATPALGRLMQDTLEPEWQPLVRIRSRGDQVYVASKEAGDNINLMVVTMDRDDAVVATLKLSPKRLSEFINHPSLLGMSVRELAHSAREF